MKMERRKLTVSISAWACLVFGSLMGFPFGAAQAAEYTLKIPFGLEETAVAIPADNPLTKEKVELGRLLFFDKRLSQDNTIACANCHMAKFAFTDGKPVSTGIRGQKG
ncbi:MAG: cytochrome-c peroxidase, partial [Nitrospira sp.]|nr:cytochrome-c peroxidase [Nitrospira sp.]